MRNKYRLFLFLVFVSLLINFSYRFDLFGFKTSFFFEIFKPISYFYERPISYSQSEDVKSLKNEIVILKREITSLKRELEIKEDYTKDYIEAKVVFVDNDKMQINVGANNGITLGQKVVSGKTIIGVVIDVTRNKSLVGLLNNNNISIFCGAEQNGQKIWGVLTGDISGRVVLTKILSDKKLEKGDLVFCEGFLAGKISEIQKNSQDLFYFAVVLPSLNFSHLDTVYVVN